MTLHSPNPPPDSPTNQVNPVARVFHNSNSTAHIFLGGARKSWMLNRNLPLNNPAAISANLPIHRPAAMVPLSTRSVDSSSPVVAAEPPQQQQQNHQQSGTSSQPSPRIYTSPSTATATERNGVVRASPSAVTFPSSPVRQDSPSQNNPVVPASIASPSNTPQDQVPGRVCPPPLSHSHHPASGPAPTPPPAHPLPPTAPVARPPWTPESMDEDFFMRARGNLNQYIGTHRNGTRFADSLDYPRIQLLSKACMERDLTYLFLHQIYCLNSCAPSQVRKLLVMTPRHTEGLATLRHLLVDNSLLSKDFLRWSIHFPSSLHPMMLLLPAYQRALDQVGNLLSDFADKWSWFEQNVLARGYPPLVDDMIRDLNVRSPVLQLTIFLSLSRRIPGANVEGGLQPIFAQNQANVQRRYGQQISDHQMQLENKAIVSKYLASIASQKKKAGNLPHQNPGLASPNLPPPPAQVSSSEAPPLRAMPPTSVSRPFAPLLSRPPPSLPPNTSPVAPPMATAATSSYPAGREMSALQQVQHPSQAPQPDGMSHARAAPAAQGMVAHGGQHSHSLHPSNTHHHHHPQHQSTPLLPPAGAVVVANPNPIPNEVALHQAHLRNPVRRILAHTPTGVTETKSLLYPDSFKVPPQPLGPNLTIFRWQFSLSKEETGRFPALESLGTGRRMLQTVMEGNQIYRFRCIKIPPTAIKVDGHSWCVAETVWPTVIYVFINDVELFPRRKIHNGRDLPLDLTQHLQEGVNRVTVHLIRSPTEENELTYAAAVEVLTYSSLSQAKNLVQSLPAAESREQIRRRLTTRPPDNDDDDLKIVSDYLVVSLVDPFTARLFTVPVRGRHCEHRECFDHETFLQTRALKSGDRSVETDWRCPICRRDARPHNLIMDGFLAAVRSEVERMNRSDDARAVQIKADGSWELKTDDADHLPSSAQETPLLSKRKSAALDRPFSPPPLPPSYRLNIDLPEKLNPLIVLD
ncbi:hypothetical protein P175DRAFT_0498170 [Aspergillus ochraceoroseus IBT 24754]|uniref:SP-RING-type domain-containing protein n=1 Tax=Aspergillus ochraceoroseus IBT 24754 TaxID=1392256 RepID=A0A2T5M947_9EURO|nr:uncharacterized protein P175DRAFT_0498170 [Aspergillus ochraceoroseus IBT 24754]PTU25059.1 hypothetical protein P175DRAFT_0498170 [Aspergillus ochraceoroseus IBT 24754]